MARIPWNKLPPEEAERRRKAYKQRWYARNRRRILKSRKSAYAADPEPKIAYARAYEKAHPEKKKAYVHSEERWPKHVAYHREYNRKHDKERYANDPVYRAKKLMRSAMYRLMKARGIMKSSKAQDLIGCDWSQLKTHLESTFTEAMSWDCFGKIEVDHIRPCCSFDLSVPEQQRACWHYTNLRCMWKEDNRAKMLEDKKVSLKLLAKAAVRSNEFATV